jgi:hypothetical protein
MKRRQVALRVGVVILAGIAFLTLVTIAVAHVSSNYDLSWYHIAGGGGKMESAGHTMHGTLGQPLTGASISSGHTLCSGFWCGVGSQEFRVYVPLALRSPP